MSSFNVGSIVQIKPKLYWFRYGGEIEAKNVPWEVLEIDHSKGTAWIRATRSFSDHSSNRTNYKMLLSELYLVHDNFNEDDIWE